MGSSWKLFSSPKATLRLMDPRYFAWRPVSELLGREVPTRPRGPHRPRGSRSAASLQGDMARLCRALPGTIQGPSPSREGCVAEKALSPGEGEKACRRRLLPRAGRKEQSSEHGATPLSHQRLVRGMHPLRRKTRMVNTRRKPTAVGKQKTSLPMPSKEKTDKTGWSRPISTACQSAWRTAGLAVPPGMATA
jgi:hypothetical protein